MEWLTQPESWIALVTLTVLEIVLGIDNIIFISILSGKLVLSRNGCLSFWCRSGTECSVAQIKSSIASLSPQSVF